MDIGLGDAEEPLTVTFVRSANSVFIVAKRRETAEELRELRAVRESEERLRLAANTGFIGIHDFDIAAGTTQWSPELRAIMGVADDVALSFDHVHQTLHDDDRERVLAAMQASLDPGGTGEFAEEFRIRRIDTGETRWVFNRCRTLFGNADGVRLPVRSAGAIIDITDRKIAEEQLRRALHNIELFLGVVGHDVRNPLAAILMSAVAGELATQDSHLHKVFAQISSSGRQIEEIIAQLLDVSSIRSGRLGLAAAHTDAAELCRECIAELEVGYPGARLSLRVDGEVVGIWDPVRLRQAVSNVLRNAVQHASGGPHAEVVVEATRDGVAIRVRNGGSIPQSVMPVLFEPFRRAGRSEGHGLGLYITREIVAAHGGELSVESHEATGTTVTIQLPRSRG